MIDNPIHNGILGDESDDLHRPFPPLSHHLNAESPSWTNLATPGGVQAGTRGDGNAVLNDSGAKYLPKSPSSS